MMKLRRIPIAFQCKSARGWLAVEMVRFDAKDKPLPVGALGDCHLTAAPNTS
jgi:hypothetical protein